MNVVALITYALAAALVLTMSGWLLEWALTTFRLPARWVWLGALVLSVWLPFAALVVHPQPEAPASGSNAVGIVELPGLPPVAEVSPAGGARTRGAFSLLDDWTTDLRRETASAAAELPQVGVPRAWIAAVWGGSSLLVAIIVVASMLRLNRRTRWWPGEQLLGRDVKISPDMGPATVGIFSPQIAIPKWARELPAEELELVLRHEGEHVRARDTLLLGIALVPLVACPWNPLVWWQVKRLKAAVEVDCDRRVLRHGVLPTRYGNLLVRLGSRGHPIALVAPAIAASTSLLERRIRLMITLRSRTSIPSAVIAMGAAVLLTVVACAGEAPMGLNSTVTTEAAQAAEIPASYEPSTDPVLPIWINRNGSVEVNGTVHPIERLSDVLKPLFNWQTVIAFEAHEATPYRMVAAVQDEVRAAGFLRVVFSSVASDAQRSAAQNLNTLGDNGLRVVLPRIGRPPAEVLEVNSDGPVVRNVGGPTVVVEAAALGVEQTEPGPPLSLEVPRIGRVLVHRGEDAHAEEVALADLEAFLLRELAQNAGLVTVVKTHPDAEYKRMHDTLGALQRAGAKRYTLQLAK